MQVVFVHGVNNRDSADGTYAREVATRTDRLDRLVFGGASEIRNPYWGRFGRPGRTLASVPKLRGGVQTLGLEEDTSLPLGAVLDPAGLDLREIVGTLSVGAMKEAASLEDQGMRHAVEDYWMAAAGFAEMRPRPSWLAQSPSLDEIVSRIGAEIEVMRNSRSLGSGWKPTMSGANDFAAARIRSWSAGFLAQFLGDAFMFFSRRAAGEEVRHEIADSIVDAAEAAAAKGESLVLMGHSMGGSILHDMLTDPDRLEAMEARLGRPLVVDLFLSVGTQIGLFAELGQFTPSRTGRPLAVQCENYWNIFDFADTLSFLCAPALPGAIDLEINTAGGVLRAHNAYFDNAVFYSRTRARLLEAGLLS